MMRLTARYADDWDTNFRKMEQLPALQTALDGACTEEGRDPSTLARSANITVAATGEPNPFGMGAQVSGTVEEMAAGLRAYANLRFSQVVVWLTPCTLAGIEAFAPVLELLDRGT